MRFLLGERCETGRHIDFPVQYLFTAVTYYIVYFAAAGFFAAGFLPLSFLLPREEGFIVSDDDGRMPLNTAMFTPFLLLREEGFSVSDDDGRMPLIAAMFTPFYFKRFFAINNIINTNPSTSSSTDIYCKTAFGLKNKLLFLYFGFFPAYISERFPFSSLTRDEWQKELTINPVIPRIITSIKQDHDVTRNSK